MRLIDILNKIANGELKEGTKVKLLYDDTIYELYCDDLIREEDNRPFFDLYSFEVFREEVELIEPQEPTDNTKIEELDVVKCEPMLYNSHAIMGMIIENRNKLNEVIRYINKEG
jgi:hypothetical protein